MFAENILRAKEHVLRHFFSVFYWKTETERSGETEIEREKERDKEVELAGIFSVEEI